MKQKVLVVGARPNSIGAVIADAAQATGYLATTAGISGEENSLDVVADSIADMGVLLGVIQPTHIVCTVGINTPEPVFGDLRDWYGWHFEANVTGPMRLLKAWGVLLNTDTSKTYRHFVAISSNSARVPRSQSAAYCASKAALSQALRVKAREGANKDGVPLVYGYEPGLVRGTPMTAETERQFGDGVPLTRMRDLRLATGLPAAALASLVVHNLSLGPEVNGVLFPLDADEA